MKGDTMPDNATMREGFYWFRGTIEFGYETYNFPEFAIVRVVGDDIRLMGDDTTLAIADARGEWIGPLMPPRAVAEAYTS